MGDAAQKIPGGPVPLGEFGKPDEGERIAAEAEQAKAAAEKPVDTGPDTSADGVPPWAKVPKGLVMPLGRKVWFMRCRAELTHAPLKGDRQCILWACSDMDERIAFARAQGDANRVPPSMAKQMIRAIDGFPVDWSGEPGTASADAFWTEIGGKYRTAITNLWAQTSRMTEKELVDFFENCLAVRSTA